MKTLKLCAATVAGAVGFILFVGGWLAGLCVEAYLMGVIG